MSEQCAMCGEPADDHHHLTGRDGSGEYLDPNLWLPACHTDHELVHDDWHTLGIFECQAARTFTERLELRLRRLAVVLARFAEARPGFAWLAGWAETVRAWAEDLAADTRARDRRDPSWREDPAFRPAGAEE